MLDVRRLRVLREVAAHGSFSAAAESLSYTQSAVSQQIAALEREAGTRLVERSARGVKLTDAGRALVAPRRRDPRPPGRRRGGAARRSPACAAAACASRAFPSACATLMPQALAAFRERHPGVELSLLPGRARRRPARCCAPASSTSRCRSRRRSALRARRAGLDALALLDDPMYIMLPRDHPLARRRSLKLTDLADEPWMIGTAGTCPDTSIFLRACQVVGLRAEHRLQPGRLQRDPGLRRRGHGRVVHPRPRAGRRARRHRRSARSARGPPVRRIVARRWPTRSARPPSRRCSTARRGRPRSSRAAPHGARARSSLTADRARLQIGAPSPPSPGARSSRVSPGCSQRSSPRCPVGVELQQAAAVQRARAEDVAGRSASPRAACATSCGQLQCIAPASRA